MAVCTEDGSVNAVPQILYGQYLRPISYYGSIWELYVLDLKTKFFVEREPATFFQGQGTHSAKIVLIVWPEIPQMPHKISSQFVCPGPKVSNF